ncbi:MAG: TolC family protein [Myxococcales bacterium]|jgi:outer membrane protein TolC|nr:TolC family protein [Myxococcales bacterium]
MSRTHTRLSARKTPTIARIIAYFFLVSVLPTSVSAQELSIEEVEERARAVSVVQGMLETRQAALVADSALGLRFEPAQLQYGHEQIFGDDTVGYLQGSILYEQPFDLVSWRDDARQATAHRSRVLGAQQSSDIRNTTTRARYAFYQTLYAQFRIQVLVAWQSRLTQALDRATSLQSQGEIAPLDVMRLRQQAALVTTRLALEQSDLSSAASELADVLRLDSLPTASGVLRPDQVVHFDIADTPEIVGLHASLQALDAERSAYRSPFLRQWVVAGGYRFSQVANSFGQGVLLSLTVPLDTRSNQRLAYERIDALAELQTREVDRARQIQAAAVLRATGRYQRAVSALQSLALDRDTALLEVADRARDAGEITLTEWLDLHENEAEIQLGLLAVEHECRRSAIELAHLSFQGEIE